LKRHVRHRIPGFKIERGKRTGFAAELLKLNPDLEVIVCTAFASIERRWKRCGAVRWITSPNPLRPKQVRQGDGPADPGPQRSPERVAELESRISTDTLTGRPDHLRSRAVAKRRSIWRSRPPATPATILLVGPKSGRGKTVVARALHEISPQRDTLL